MSRSPQSSHRISQGGKSVRAFWAVCPPEDGVLSEAAGLLRELKRPLAGLGLEPSWVRGDGLHITLKFLGDLPEEEVGEIVGQVESSLATAGLLVPRVQLGGLGLFAGPERPSVVFAEVLAAPEPHASMKAGEVVHDEATELLRLQGALEGWHEQLGIPREPRAYNPHLTLARIKNAPPDRDGSRARGLRELLSRYQARRYGPAFAIEELVLFESRLGPQGAVYEPLARLPVRPPMHNVPNDEPSSQPRG